MAETSSIPPPSPPPPPPPPTDEGPSSSSTTYFGGQSRPSEVEEGVEEPSEVAPQPPAMTYRVRSSNRYTITTDDHSADESFSCAVVILTFWFFVSMTLIMGIFGSNTLQVGPNSSILLRPNPLFVESLKVETSDDTEAAPVLYGLYETPPLDNTMRWSESVNATIQPENHKEWIYYLNKGSQINVSYNVVGSSSLLLVVAKGVEGFAEWIEDPSYPDSTLSWNIICGSGSLRQDITRFYDYYVGIANVNSIRVKVELNFSIRSSMHAISDSYYKCSLRTSGMCNLKIPFPGGTAALLTTPEPLEDTGGNRLKVKLSYEPRWLTYLLGIGGMTIIMLGAFNLLNKIRRNMQDATENQSGDMGSERAPLLSQKDDDLLSLGSSYDSASQDGDETQEDLEEGCKRLCVICFDAPKDCFFIPCGHCATCFSCGIRIAEDAANCPICRRKMKKVRRIFTV